MLVDRKQVRWAILAAAVLTGSAGYYVSYARHALNGPNGRTWPGLGFGAAGSAMILGAAAIGLRKKRPTWRIGRAETWLRAHLWLGLLSGPMILFHSGFLVGGTLTLVLWVLLVLVLVTGLIGLGIQQVVPRMMTQRVPVETIYDQIDHVIGRLRQEADELVAARCGPLDGDPAARGRGPAAEPIDPVVRASQDRLREFYASEVRPYLRPRRPTGRGDLRSESRSILVFARLRALLAPELHDALQTLQDLCAERRQMEAQRRLHLLLHGWVLVHAPLSWALVVLGAVHAVGTLRF